MEKKFGKYIVKQELGHGAMGTVYLAFDPILEREVAIKTISSTIREEHLKERFIREARAAGKLCHSNIVTVFDFGTETDQLYIAMEYLKGQDLFRFIADKTPLDIKDKLEIVRQICLGLEYAHQNGIFHRDIKPANILLLPGNQIKIVDFGLAVIQTSTLTRSGAILGTPHYTSPERLSGKPADGKADQFATGIILYELLTYNRAFDGDSISNIIFNILNTHPRKLTGPVITQFPRLQAIIEKAISKDPGNRYPTMQKMADEIGDLILSMKNTQFDMKDPISIIDMDFEVSDTEAIHSGNIKTEKQRSKVWGASALAILIILFTFIIYWVYFGGDSNENQNLPSSTATGSSSEKTQIENPQPTLIQGYFAFDVMPYAVVRKIENIKTGEIIIPEAPDNMTPLTIKLNPGTYRVEYEVPGSGKIREITTTIQSDAESYFEDWLDESFRKEAIENFKVSEK